MSYNTQYDITHKQTDSHYRVDDQPPLHSCRSPGASEPPTCMYSNIVLLMYEAVVLLSVILHVGGAVKHHQCRKELYQNGHI